MSGDTVCSPGIAAHAAYAHAGNAWVPALPGRTRVFARYRGARRLRARRQCLGAGTAWANARVRPYLARALPRQPCWRPACLRRIVRPRRLWQAGLLPEDAHLRPLVRRGAAVEHKGPPATVHHRAWSGCRFPFTSGPRTAPISQVCCPAPSIGGRALGAARLRPCPMPYMHIGPCP